jgi:phosphoglycerate dehydrogenase-like enzyme
VFEKEPLPADSPLWDIPNVIVSPHNASASSGNDIRAAKIFTENIKLYAAGQRMDNEQN